jgi:hypothetical protein
MKLTKRQFKKDFPDYAKQLDELQSRIAAAQELFVKLTNAGIPNIWTPSHSLTSCTMGVTLTNLTGFKDDRLVTVLDTVLSFDPEGCRSSDYPNNLNRDYRFDFPGSIIVCVYAYVVADSPTCRKVVVGEQYVEARTEYVFALECD